MWVCVCARVYRGRRTHHLNGAIVSSAEHSASGDEIAGCRPATPRTLVSVVQCLRQTGCWYEPLFSGEC